MLISAYRFCMRKVKDLGAYVLFPVRILVFTSVVCLIGSFWLSLVDLHSTQYFPKFYRVHFANHEASKLLFGRISVCVVLFLNPLYSSLTFKELGYLILVEVSGSVRCFPNFLNVALKVLSLYFKAKVRAQENLNKYKTLESLQ